MGTAILRPQDCLARFPRETLMSPPPKQSRNPNPTRYGRRKRSPSDSESDRSPRTMVVKFPAKNLVMEKVTILKRGEDIGNTMQVRKSDETKKKTMQVRKSDETKKKTMKVRKSDERLNLENGSDVFSKNRLGPEPEMIPKEIRLNDTKAVDVEMFAGSFVTSPSPSSLPFPAFFTKKTNCTATNDLRRLLRLV